MDPRTGPHGWGVDRGQGRPPTGLTPAAAVATRAETGGIRRGLSIFTISNKESRLRDFAVPMALLCLNSWAQRRARSFHKCLRHNNKA